MTACARGCSLRGRHLTTCQGGRFAPVPDPPDALFDADHPHAHQHEYWIRWGGLEHWRDCHGCLPAEARHGVLCDADHNRLVRWLGGGLQWTYAWLGANLARGGSSAARQDWQRPGGKDGPPSPIRESVHDLRTLLWDRVYIADERVREVFDRQTLDTYSMDAACNFLSAWLTKIEEDADLVVWMWEKFHEVMRDAANVCRWEDRPRPIVGIACPHCETESLARFPGDENVTCRTCWASIPPDRYEIWVRMLACEAT